MRKTKSNIFWNNLKSEVKRCIVNHEVLLVRRKNKQNFIVISEKDWRAVEETLYINQFPGLVASIHEAAKEPLDDGIPLEALEW